MTIPRVEPIDSQWRVICSKSDEHAVRILRAWNTEYPDDPRAHYVKRNGAFEFIKPARNRFAGIHINELRDLYITELERREEKRREEQKTAQEKEADLRLAARYFAFGLILGLGPRERQRKKPTTSTGDMLKHILIGVCVKYGLTRAEVKSKRRTRNLIPARQEFCYRAVMETPASMPQIGRFLGGRDHTTVLHAARRHADINRLPRHDRVNNGAG